MIYCLSIYIIQIFGYQYSEMIQHNYNSSAELYLKVWILEFFDLSLISDKHFNLGRYEFLS